MSEKEEKAQELLMIVATVEKESMVSLNSDHIIIRDYRKGKRPSIDHTEASYVQGVSNPESSEHSSSRKSKLLRRSEEQAEKTELICFDPI